MGILIWNKETAEWREPETGEKLSGSDVDPTFPGDVEITDATKGIIFTSATKRWRLNIDDTGELIITDLTPL